MYRNLYKCVEHNGTNISKQNMTHKIQIPRWIRK